MPIHFSIGFAIEENPKRAFVAECALYSIDVDVSACYLAEVQITANYVNVVNVNAVWPREEKCK